MPPQSSSPFRLFVLHRNFRIFWSGQTVSQIGTWMQTVATGWLALQLSNSAFVVGVVSAAESFPVLVLSLYGGVVADRYNKLKLVTIAQTLLLLQALMLWGVTSSQYLSIGLLIGLTTFNGIVSAFEIPARQSLTVDLVGREDIVEAIALNSGGFNLARIIGPSIAAVVIGTLGLQRCYALNAFSYLAVLVSLFMIRLPPWQRTVSEQSPLEGFKEGFAYIRGNPMASVLIRVVGVYAVFGLPILAMMPVIARDVMGTGAAGYGFLLTCVGVGALAGALSIAWLSTQVRQERMFVLSTYSFAVLLILFCLFHPHSIVIAAVLLLMIGFTMLLNGALANGLLQATVPNALRGRVVSAYIFVYVGLAPIGSFLAGVVASTVGVLWAIGGGAVIMLLYAAWAFRVRPLAQAGLTLPTESSTLLRRTL